MGIRTKLLLGLIPGFLFILVLVLLAYGALRVVLDHAQTVEGIYYQHEAIEELWIVVSQALDPPANYLITGDPRERERFARLAAEVEVQLDALDGLLKDAEEQRVLTEAVQQWRQVRTLTDAILALPDPVGSRQGARLLKQLDASASELFDAFFTLVQMQQAEITGVKRTTQVYRARLSPIFLLGTILSFAGGLIYVWHFSTVLTRPLLELTRTAEALGQGDVSARVRVTGQDEFARLGQALNSVAESLQRRLREQEALADIARIFQKVADRDALFAELTARIAELLDAEQCAIALREEETGDFVLQCPAYGMTPGQVALGRFPAAQAERLLERIPRDEALIVEEFSREAGVTPELVGPWRERSLLIARLQVEERVLGGIRVANKRSGERFTRDDARLLGLVANLAAVALQNAWLFEQVRASHERLRRLSHQLVEVQEAERRRIARELHDEIGQALTGLKLTLETGLHLSPDALPDVLKESLKEAHGLVDELIERVRGLSLDLRPAILDDLGLLPALLWYFERYTAQTNVRVAFKHAGLDRRFTSEVETMAYRIVQEALTNVARHAGVQEVTVRVWVDEQTLCVQVEDRGVGFDPEVVLRAGKTSGLAGMRERAAAVGGRLIIESAPRAGTKLTAELPLDQGATDPGQPAAGEGEEGGLT